MKKKKLISLILLMSFLISFVSPIIFNLQDNIILADEYVDPEEEIKDNENKKRDFLNALKNEGFEKSVPNVVGKLESKPQPKVKDDSLSWFVNYMFTNGNYINDVNSGIFVGNTTNKDKTLLTTYNGRKTVCHHTNEPQNLLNHNCDIPSFGTELFQIALKEKYKQGIVNGELTSAKASWGFGVPISIPNNTVPIEENKRTTKFTALELFG